MAGNIVNEQTGATLTGYPDMYGNVGSNSAYIKVKAYGCNGCDELKTVSCDCPCS